MPNWLGDCVMALPAVAQAAAGLPEADVHLAAREAFLPLFAAQPGVRGVLAAPGSGLGAALSGFSAGRRAARVALGGGTFDAGLLLTNSFSTALWLRGVGAKERIGYGTDGRRIFLTRPVPCGEAEKSWHFVEYYRRLAKALVAACGGGEGTLAEEAEAVPRVAVPEAARERVRGMLREKGIEGRYVVFAPASAYGEVKDWPAARYRELAALLHAECALPVVVTGGAGQREVCEAIAAGRKSAVSVAGETGLMEFAGLIAESAGFVGGDSGGAHVAGALGIPTAVIFGITNPTRTRPRGKKVTLIGAGEGKDVKLSTPEARAAAKKALESISTEQVFAALQYIFNNQ